MSFPRGGQLVLLQQGIVDEQVRLTYLTMSAHIRNWLEFRARWMEVPVVGKAIAENFFPVPLIGLGGEEGQNGQNGQKKASGNGQAAKKPAEKKKSAEPASVAQRQ